MPRIQQDLRLLVLRFANFIDKKERANHKTPRIWTFRWPTARAETFRRVKMRFDRCNDMLGNFILDGEDVFKTAVIFVGPDMLAIFSFNQLRRDAEAISLANATFQHVANTEFATDLTNVDRLAFVDELRVARDH